jgi:hypothetical protein
MTGEGVDSGVITPPDVMVSPPDVSADSSVEIDAPPVTIDREVPPIDVSADIAVPPVDVATPVDASITCDPSGPVVSIERVNMQKGEACAGQLAARTFTYAVCTCEDFTAKGLLTGSFDSTVNAVNTQQAGAPVGIAGSFISLSSAIDSVASFGGSVTIAGLPARSALITTPFDVSGDLRIAGPTTFWWRLTTARDLWLLSQVGYLSFVSVLRNYHRGPVGSLRGLTLPIIAGSSTVDGAFTVDDPCGCAQRLDIAAMEAAGSVKNDNALLGIDGASLARVSGTVRLELPCGRFRFDSIGGSGILQLVIHGRTAMFVDAQADLSLIDFQLTLDPGAELDVFVRTNLVLGTKLGDPNHAAAVRVYVGGSADIAIPTAAFGANLYAPNANLSITTQTIAGSVFGKGVTVPEWSHIRYDRAVLSQGNKCGQAATCEKCGCNGGLVCKADGTCGQCAVDEDCCQPLVCSQGTCQPLLPPY